MHPRMGNIDGCLKNLMDAWRTPQEATIRWKKEAGLLGGTLSVLDVTSFVLSLKPDGKHLAHMIIFTRL